jgi:hypothetical protein
MREDLRGVCNRVDAVAVILGSGTVLLAWAFMSLMSMRAGMNFSWGEVEVQCGRLGRAPRTVYFRRSPLLVVVDLQPFK